MRCDAFFLLGLSSFTELAAKTTDILRRSMCLSLARVEVKRGRERNNVTETYFNTNSHIMVSHVHASLNIPVSSRASYNPKLELLVYAGLTQNKVVQKKFSNMKCFGNKTFANHRCQASRAGVSKCGARLETLLLLRGPTQGCVEIFGGLHQVMIEIGDVKSDV